MKQPYTQYAPSIRWLQKDPALRGISESELVCRYFAAGQKRFGWTADHIANLHLSATEPHSAEEIDHFRILQGLVTDASALLGNCSHIFISSPDFCRWLEDSAGDVLTPRHMQAAIESFYSGDNLTSIFHFPTASNRESFAIAPVYRFSDKAETLLSISWSASAFPGQFSLLSCRECSTSHKPGRLPQIARLLCGLGLYINCFPETVRPGVPEDLAHPSHHKYADALSIGIAPAIQAIKGTHASPCGHFRNGHFRVLRSDKFTKKRWQAIFIAETFVKGKASTVLSPEQTG